MSGGMLASSFTAAAFAGAGYLGSRAGARFADRIEPFDDAPPQQNVPIGALVVACGAVGAIVASHATIPQLFLTALLCACLMALWITDARRGIIPDVFTLGPLAAVFFAAIFQHRWTPFLSAAAVCAPFAILALVSRGRGMGWGDVKLAALGGAVLGAGLSLLAFALACVAAGGLNYARGRKRGAIALGPYLAAAIGIAMPFVAWG
jgi:prepilin signal peptidase PulO-like enzyme (type II secretory pathway)